MLIKAANSEHNSYYKGQLDHLISAHGVGRASGFWGVYEGQFYRGYPEGIGRLFDQSGNLYSGQFKNGKYDGQGEFLDAQTQKRF